ncbi:MAG: polyribonucleotide nucleotidyltransferase [Candidatus Yanofskybacteria bacterium RIFCSPHIGHO2_02_FULL_43_15c]|uniref:Polyribonucleotide nucleotidyltransferase n=1 Tax=Candidatus Yanofskybacteria bacterium RIFCSPHIGHO2_02_FULL_43_15c TaxID=1802679 RepID=A0A1F8FKS4_9BACT|nr:MAG: polyribonucleotide nucleotidyltransferase [Candidatus Yanofskybacteria bacterium RIFCSPHIGHO2_02_FULL_43_15c]
MAVKNYSEDFAGRKLSVELGRLAGQANGSCRVQYGDTTILVTATMSAHPKDADYFPLSVDYEEKYYAAGKIKGSKWIKRETRPSEEAILAGRLIDRSLRPRFNQGVRNEVQVVPTVLTFDSVNDPDVISLFGASLALMISDIPFSGPVAGVRVGRVDGKLIVNPTYEERRTSDFDIVVSGTANRINMIEAGAKIIPEKEMAEAVEFGFKELQKLIKFQEKIAAEIAPKKKELVIFSHDEALVKLVKDFVSPKLEKVLYTPHKAEYVEGLHRTSEELAGYISSEFAGHPDLPKKLKEAAKLFEEEIDYIVHRNIVEQEKRPDGRKVDQLRDLSSEIGILPHSHGTGLFNRGTTQVLSVLTLASPGMEQWVETMEIELTKKRFMHHYIFPPFSVGEVGRMGFTGRREIGHGALAERALEPLIPPKEEFPYTIRVVSETLSSNGSSSMASVCGSSLALMDGGVPIKSHIGGIAMGLMFEQETRDKEQGVRYKILTDIQGPEDHHGDMDLKVAGTKEGVTAIQMDVKIEGITPEIFEEALAQAKKARLEILEVLSKAIKEPREELSPYAPRIKTIKINPDKIRTLIGPGGKMINDIIDKTGVDIDIEDDGNVFVTAENPENMDKAIKLIEAVTFEEKPGDEFDGKVTRLLDFGAMVEYLPGREGLVHVSEISNEHIRRPSDVLKSGQSVRVRVKNIDEYGRINLSMKSVKR